MAYTDRCERFSNATIDVKDMTITEYTDDSVRTFSILEILKRWDGVSGIRLSIRHSNPITEEGRAADES